MKLVKGQTLATLLAARKEPGEERPKFLKVFEQVCQTLAFAHSKGVIHRDLQPAAAGLLKVAFPGKGKVRLVCRRKTHAFDLLLLRGARVRLARSGRESPGTTWVSPGSFGALVGVPHLHRVVKASR